MSGECILIVEDNPSHIKLMRDLLTIEGYHVQVATSAEDVFSALARFHPQLILADIQLPGMNGIELTRQLKVDNRYRDINIIAITAYAMEHDRVSAIQAGCVHYITKPINTVTLPLIIRKYLDAKLTK